MKNVRSSDPLTSVMAAERSAKFAGGHYAKIISQLKAGRGLTAGDISNSCGLSVEQVCRRLPEMKNAGLVSVVQHEGKDLIINGYRVWKAL